jgi:hypothetical protein
VVNLFLPAVYLAGVGGSLGFDEEKIKLFYFFVALKLSFL